MSSYATMGAQDSQSVWRITSTSGGGTIDPGEVFRLQATDNSRRLKSRSSGVRVLSWSGTTSNWRLGCSFVPGVYTEWTTRPTFSSATNPNEHVDLGLARSWLEAHVASVTLPFGEGTLIAWDDPNVDPDDPDNVDYFDPFNPGYVAYLMTDNLWAQHALEPFEPDLSGAIKDTIVSTGWYGDRLFDALFHHVGTLAVGAGQMADPDQGIPLGSCGTDDGRVVQVRAFDYTIDTEALAFGMQHLIDIAVYEAMNQYWGSTNSFVRNSARNKIRAIVQDTRGSWPDLMFWDTERAQLVDWLTREDFDDGGTYVFAPYKLGLVLYAIKVMGITDIPQTTIDRMKERLAEAQWSASAGQNSGGVAHLVEYDANHNFQLASPPTGEATSIAIMAHTVDEAP
ncbi:MAG: hypothetical protein OXR73_14795 [Myxococcales bacterium]|nr:hypothetical protein [Myxococcales bacterium]